MVLDILFQNHTSSLPSTRVDDVYVIYSNNEGIQWNTTDSISFNARPVIVLNKDIVLTSGDGTKENPYTV